MFRPLIFCSFLFVFAVVNAQNSSVKNFWEMVNVKLSRKEMTSGMRYWLINLAENKTKSPTKALAILENIRNEISFQDEVFLNIYTANYKSKEDIRLLLGNLCGSFSVGNPVADWVIERYNKDPRALRIISNQKKIAETIAENKQKETKRLEDAAVESYKTRIFSVSELENKIAPQNLEVIDSLFDLKVLDLLEKKQISMSDAYGVGKVFGVNSVWLIVDGNGNTISLNEDKCQTFGFDRNEDALLKNELFDFFKYLKFDCPKYEGYNVKCDINLQYDRQYMIDSNQFTVEDNGTIFWEYVDASGKTFKRFKLDKGTDTFENIYNVLKKAGVYNLKMLTRWKNPINTDDVESQNWKIGKVVKVFEANPMKKTASF